jgi:electron transport complex protein RnfA
LIIAGLVQFVEMFIKKSMPSLYNALGIYLPLITTNCAVLGVTLLNVQNYPDSFLFSLLYGVFAALGFTLAIVLMAGIREFLDEDSVPESFRGFPITLITAGLMALAFMGFSGFSIG